MKLYVIKNDYNGLIYYVKSNFDDLVINDRVIINIDDVLFSGSIIKIENKCKNN